MPASTQLLVDVQTVIANGPSATTTANSIAAVGPISDYSELTNSLLTKLAEADGLLGQVDGNTDPVDDSTNQALLDGILAALEGSASPSVTLITDLSSVITNGPSVTTQSNSIDPDFTIMDYVGNCFVSRTKLKEAEVLVTLLVSLTASSDDSTNKALLQGVGTALT